MTGPKLNEKSFVAGERTGTRASAKYVRASATKARQVLDLIRDLDVVSADQVLQFTDREMARVVRKVLASAVANAQQNDQQEPEELYVKACYADEGPTLRRFKPRARGRATRIRKRTCHITVIVARMDDDKITIVQARRERQGGGRAVAGASARRARVAASRQRAADRKAAKAAGELDAIEANEEAEAAALAADEAVESDVVEVVDADVTVEDVDATEQAADTADDDTDNASAESDDADAGEEK